MRHLLLKHFLIHHLLASQSSFQNTFRVAFPGSPHKRVTGGPVLRPHVLRSSRRAAGAGTRHPPRLHALARAEWKSPHLNRGKCVESHRPPPGQDGAAGSYHRTRPGFAVSERSPTCSVVLGHLAPADTGRQAPAFSAGSPLSLPTRHVPWHLHPAASPSARLPGPCWQSGPRSSSVNRTFQLARHSSLCFFAPHISGVLTTPSLPFHQY